VPKLFNVTAAFAKKLVEFHSRHTARNWNGDKNTLIQRTSECPPTGSGENRDDPRLSDWIPLKKMRIP